MIFFLGLYRFLTVSVDAVTVPSNETNKNNGLLMHLNHKKLWTTEIYGLILKILRNLE